jgi:hypothetical protein
MSFSFRRSLRHAGRRHPICPRCYSEEAKTNAGPLTGSAKLFSDAKQEDFDGNASTRPKSAYLKTLESQAQHANWDGDERIQDAVLRMLVDKYKPLRSTGNAIESADEKLKTFHNAEAQ